MTPSSRTSDPSCHPHTNNLSLITAIHILPTVTTRNTTHPSDLLPTEILPLSTATTSSKLRIISPHNPSLGTI